MCGGAWPLVGLRGRDVCVCGRTAGRRALLQIITLSRELLGVQRRLAPLQSRQSEAEGGSGRTGRSSSGGESTGLPCHCMYMTACF